MTSHTSKTLRNITSFSTLSIIAVKSYYCMQRWYNVRIHFVFQLVALEMLKVQQVILSNGSSEVEAMNRALLEKVNK